MTSESVAPECSQDARIHERPCRTPAELRDASVRVIEALEYLHGSYRELERMNAKHIDGDDPSLVAWDGVLGSWTVNARKLIDFIDGAAHARRDDILADDFMADDSDWPTAKRGLHELDELRQRVGKEIAHLTYPTAPKAEGWDVGTGTRELARAMTVFVAHAPPEHLAADFAARTDAVAEELVYLHPLNDAQPPAPPARRL